VESLTDSRTAELLPGLGAAAEEDASDERRKDERDA
jgi:hypothetical protein